MAKYFDNFEASDIGDDGPAGWTKRWAAASSPGSFVREVAQGTPPFKKRYLATSQSAGTYGAVSLDSVDGDADRDDVEVLAIYTVPASNADTYAAVVLRGSGSAASENGYYFGLIPGSNQIDVGSLVGGAAASIAAPAVTLTPGESYWMRCRIDGTTIRARVWRVGSTEPTTWLVDGTNSAVAGAGWVGFWNLGNGKEGAWNCISVATASETAVTPLLNTEYQAWLENPANAITVLAELSATGYDLAGGAPYTKTIKAYLSSSAYATQAQDVPASTQYQPIITVPPTFRREMAEAFYGEVSAGFGNLVISNPQDPTTGAGVRDDWLRAKWSANEATVYLGAPGWSKHDFRKVIVGRLAQPVAPQTGEIVFGLTGLADMLDVPLQTNYYANTVPGLENLQKPILLGSPIYVEPPKIDGVTNQYQVHDGALEGEPIVYDDGIGLQTTTFTISAVNTGTDTITTSTTHGMVPGYGVTFFGSLPAPLVSGTYYWVKTTPTTSSFTLAATEGGATIDLTTSTTGGTLEGFGWWPVLDSPDGCFKLAAPASGRVMVEAAEQSPRATANLVAEMIEWLVFTKAGISANYKDADRFAALASTGPDLAGIWFEPGTAITVQDALFRVAQGAFCWAGWSADGLLQVGEIALPSISDAVQAFNENDVQEGSLALTRVLLPIDMTQSDVVVNRRYFRGGALSSGGAQFQSLFVLDDRVTYAASTPPLDDDPTLSECRRGVRFESILQAGIADRLATLYGKKLGIFEVTINHLGPATLSVGDTIGLTHDRYGWRTWGSTEASPDNSLTVDSRAALVLGQEVDFAARTVRLTLLRQIPGYYPEEDFAP